MSGMAVRPEGANHQWRKHGRESDRVVRPLKPGNAGGGKDPDFWCAFEDGEVVVIGDEPENTIKDKRRPRLLCRGAKGPPFIVENTINEGRCGGIALIMCA
jgi:hypothetical protein